MIGGTRGTGLLLAHRLLERGFRVRVLARDPRSASSRLDPDVEVIAGDVTVPRTLPPALQDADHLVFTAGVRSGRPAGERLVRATEYEGVRNTLAAARAGGLRGRFVYLTSIGVRTRSWAATMLDLLKGNTLRWRGLAEEEIRSSGLDYAIVRAGFLVNRPGGRRAVRVSQEDLPLAPRHRIARADVADALVEALRHPAASRATFDLVWVEGERREGWDAAFSRLRPDVVGAARAG